MLIHFTIGGMFMSLFSYYVFNTVVKQKSFLRAAEVISITPSAVSHSIASLEKRLGFPLFNRKKTGVQLTVEGERLLVHVRAILNCEEQLQQEVAQILGLDNGIVRIGTFNSVCANWIPGILTSFRSLYPNIGISISQGGYEDIVDWVKTGSADIGFVTLPIKENLLTTSLYKDRLLCITPKNFKPSDPNYVTIDDIKNEPLICQREGYDADTIAIFKKYNLSIRPQFQIVDDQSIIAMVESGLGISIIPELVLNKLDCNVNVYPIEPGEYRTIGLLTQGKQFLSPATLRMYHHICTYIKNNKLLNV